MSRRPSGRIYGDDPLDTYIDYDLSDNHDLPYMFEPFIPYNVKRSNFDDFDFPNTKNYSVRAESTYISGETPEEREYRILNSRKLDAQDNSVIYKRILADRENHKIKQQLKQQRELLDQEELAKFDAFSEEVASQLQEISDEKMKQDRLKYLRQYQRELINELTEVTGELAELD